MRILGPLLIALLLACDPPMAGEPLADPLAVQGRRSVALFGAGTQTCLHHVAAYQYGYGGGYVDDSIYSGPDDRADCFGEGPLGALPPVPPLPLGLSPRGSRTYVGLADGGVQVTELLTRWDQNAALADYPVRVVTLAPGGWDDRVVTLPLLGDPDAGYASMPYTAATTADGEVFVILGGESIAALVDGQWVNRSVNDGRRPSSLRAGADGHAYALLQRDDGRGSLIEWSDGGWLPVGPEDAFDPYVGYTTDYPQLATASHGRYLLSRYGYGYGGGYYSPGSVNFQLFSSAGVEEMSPPQSLVPPTFNLAVTLTDSGDPVVAVAAADGIRLVTRTGGQWSVLAEGVAGGAGPRRQSGLLVKSIAGRLVLAWTEQEQPPYPLGLFSRGGPARIFVRRF